MPDIRHIHATYDPESRVWWAEGDDLPGLVSEAPALDKLVERVMAVARELLAANGATANEVNLEFTTTRQIQITWRGMGRIFDQKLIQPLQDDGCFYVRLARGSHDLWFSLLPRRISPFRAAL